MKLLLQGVLLSFFVITMPRLIITTFFVRVLPRLVSDLNLIGSRQLLGVLAHHVRPVTVSAVIVEATVAQVPRVRPLV